MPLRSAGSEAAETELPLMSPKATMPLVVAGFGAAETELPLRSPEATVPLRSAVFEAADTKLLLVSSETTMSFGVVPRRASPLASWSMSVSVVVSKSGGLVQSASTSVSCAGNGAGASFPVSVAATGSREMMPAEPVGVAEPLVCVGVPEGFAQGAISPSMPVAAVMSGGYAEWSEVWAPVCAGGGATCLSVCGGGATGLSVCVLVAGGADVWCVRRSHRLGPGVDQFSVRQRGWSACRCVRRCHLSQWCRGRVCLVGVVVAGGELRQVARLGGLVRVKGNLDAVICAVRVVCVMRRVRSHQSASGYVHGLGSSKDGVRVIS